MGQAPRTRWAADPIAAYRFENLGEFDLVFHRSSGQTHLLGGEAVAILGLLVDQASDEAGLTNRLAEHLKVADDAMLAETVMARIDELAEAGLITTA